MGRIGAAVGLFTVLVQSSVLRVSTTSANASSAAFVVSNTGSTTPLAKATSRMTVTRNASTGGSDKNNGYQADPLYPGTAVQRMMTARARVRQLEEEKKFSDGSEWETIRRRILWAGGLKDLPTAVPGQGYTGHSFNDYNHVDLTCMLDQMSDNENDGSVKGIAIGNRLGSGIRVASLEELGPGGSWSTCAIGCNREPPSDVAHVQFAARIAFKLVWAPTTDFDTFVLVDDDGELLATGKPTGTLPALRERQMNYRIVQGSKYAKEAEKIASQMA